MTLEGAHGSRRLAATAALLLAALLSFPVPATAWSNGGGDGYGTHDWIVDQAVKVLDGRADDWFDARTARLASDDPDTVEPRDPAEIGHVYRDSGKRGGAVARISEEFDLAQAAYQAGVAARDAGDLATATDAFRTASHHIGLLSHFVGDISQPFHTGHESSGDEDLHTGYERLVSREQWHPSDSPDWQSARRTVSTFPNIRTFAAATAAYSRQYYPELLRLLKRDGLKLTAGVDDITRRVMRRATNDLADIIWTISQGVGAGPQVGSIKLSVKWTGVRAGSTNTVFVRAYDVAGKPIEGLRVVVHWPTGNGTHIEYLYTDAKGYQQRIHGVGTSPRLVLRPVVATATVRGVVTTVTRGWTISPRLPSGKPGFKTVVSDATPAVGDVVTVTSIARNAKGRGVPNLLVTWTWDFGTVKVRTRAYTDSSGRARSSQPITEATTTATVTVTARTQSGSTNRTSTTSFRRTR